MKRIMRLSILVVIFSFFVFLGGCSSNNSDINNDEENTGEVVQRADGDFYNPLTGEKVSKLQNLTGVMVNNQKNARPQTGLTSADIVYEMEMEGKITRFFALFYGDPPENVGPVRSARPYTLALAKEWDSYFVHVGGSNEAYALVKKWDIRDIDATRGKFGFWVDKTRKAPHNTYINLEKTLQDKEKNGNFIDRWDFVNEYSNPPDYTEIKFNYSKDNTPSYIWDSEKKKYLRYINGEKHYDRETKDQIEVKNIIIQFVPHTFLGGKEGYIDIELIGKGDAEYFLGGKYFTGTWEKNSLTAPTKFYDENGNLIKPVRGNTWIQIVRPNTEIIKN